MITGTQIRMARAALKLGVRELAADAKVSPATVTRIEGGAPANDSTIRTIAQALGQRGVRFEVARDGQLSVSIVKSKLSDEDKSFVEAVLQRRVDEAIEQARLRANIDDRHAERTERSEAK